jgi:hypothetical protein
MPKKRLNELTAARVMEIWCDLWADLTITLKYDKECKEFYADDPVSVKLLQGIIANHRTPTHMMVYTF